MSQTLYHNLPKLREIDAEWIIVDYHCPDLPYENLMKNRVFKALFEAEQIKMYRLHHDLPFEMPLAKNLAHYFAQGEFVFNLDADNFIDTSDIKLQGLKTDEFLWGNVGADNGTCGRIGLSRETFFEVGGYDLSLTGAGYDDIDFANRLRLHGLKSVTERPMLLPIQNSFEERMAYVKNKLSPQELHLENQRRSKRNQELKVIHVNPEGMLNYQGRNITDITVRIEA